MNNDRIESKVTGTYKQFPLKAAWAITIHKSQGKTFDRVIIDMKGGAFESGQTYVALSRCRTLEGIVLKNPLQSRDIMIDPRILDFYQLHY
jgi:ATP-dependent exoDNAse (exonuclease V) alpha subunit